MSLACLWATAMLALLCFYPLRRCGEFQSLTPVNGHALRAAHRYGGIQSQMLFGESFEEPAGPDGVSGSNNTGGQGATWVPVSVDGLPGAGAFNVTPIGVVEGAKSQRISLISGQAASIANMGLAAQGMYFEARRQYQGYLLARSTAGVAKVRVSLGLVSGLTHALQLAELDHDEIQVSETGTWDVYNFSLSPARSSSCGQAATPRTPCVSNPEGVCIECSGGFAVSVVGDAGTSVEVDFAWLEPGSWGLSVAPCACCCCFVPAKLSG